jgi:AbrB family looped-hinge helix DNA binding protein
MLIATSRVTRQGQISVPAEVRRGLGLHPGSELIWEMKENGEVVVRPKRASLDEIHQLLGEPKVHLTDEELKAARLAFLASRIPPGPPEE